MGPKYLAFIAVVLTFAACAPAAPASRQGQTPEPVAAAKPQRTLQIIVRGERPTLAATTLVGTGALEPAGRLFNAMLDYVDQNEQPQPYLAEALPQLNTDTWRVFPDGRMETTYRLRPNLRWHDGAPMEAEDFVFGWQVFATPELGIAGTKPFRQIESVTAPDARTVVMRWRVLFPEANQLDSTFQALPRHLLTEPFQSFAQSDPAAFSNLPFWTAGYVGLGPFKVDRIEPGVDLEASAFDYHVLGRPKVDRIRLKPIADPNTALASMLSGDSQYLTDFILDYDGGTTLEREWIARGEPGTVFFAPVLIRMVQIQFRPEYISPMALQDVRVRRALAHGFDVPGALEVLTGGRGLATNTLISPRVPYYAEVERVTTRRSFDVATAQRLLEDAGYRRGSDGIFVSPSGERLSLELWTTGGQYERENGIFADSVRRIGVDATPQSLPPARLTDREYRATRPGFFVVGASDDLFSGYTTDTIPSPENRWTGSNRGGWTNQEFQRVWQMLNATLDESERVRQMVELERLIHEDVGAIPLYFSLVMTAHTGNLKGPVARMTPDAPNAIQNSWLWEWTS